ncbi:hypothetical protein F5882DRAFT_525879 [Hyaloscypha sp. PMI_1271]|nr:hypothetical protein F5882DRAFT_525879 [Hyaloscypha sp. PMI_1271]
MVTRNYTTVNLRLPQTSLPNLARLNGRTTVKRNYTDATKDNLQDIIDKFSRFCAYLGRDWRTMIRNCSKGTTIAFLIHICEVNRVKKRSAVYQYYLRFKMLFKAREEEV